MHPFYAFVYERDLRFAVDDASVVHCGTEAHFRRRRRKYPAFDGQNAARFFQRLFDVAGYFRHCRDEQIAEAVPCQIAVAGKTVLKQFFHHRFRISECYKTVAQISRRNDIEFLAQSARRTAVVRHRYNGRNIARYFFHAAQQHGKTRPAADNGDVRSFVQTAVLINHIYEPPRFVRNEYRNQRTDYHARCQQHNQHAADNDDTADNRRYRIIVCARHGIRRIKQKLLKAVEIFIIENDSQPHTGKNYADSKQKQPAFELHAGIKPFQ